MNVVIMKGNLGADAEVKQVEGRVIVSFRMAVTERGFTTKEGREIPERTDWFNVTVFAGLGTKLGEHLKKGTSVLIRGKLRTQSYPDNTGMTRTMTDIVVESRDVEFVGSKAQ